MGWNHTAMLRVALIFTAMGVFSVLPMTTGCGEDETSPPQEAPASDPKKREPGKEEKEKEKKKRQRPAPPGARLHVDERRAMVEKQMVHSSDARAPIRSAPVLEALRAVPRHVFVPARLLKYAYRDTPLPIGHGQTISQPYMVAWMTEILEIEPDHRVLEIGTGSGYQAAVLAHLTPHVYTVEIVDLLAERARRALRQQGYTEVKTRGADGYHGWKEKGPFDAIIVTCAAGHLPPPLWNQLKPGGRIVIPIGGVYELQRLVLVTKTLDGKRRSKTLGSVRFVPLTRGKRGGSRAGRSP